MSNFRGFVFFTKSHVIHLPHIFKFKFKFKGKKIKVNQHLFFFPEQNNTQIKMDTSYYFSLSSKKKIRSFFYFLFFLFFCYFCSFFFFFYNFLLNIAQSGQCNNKWRKRWTYKFFAFELIIMSIKSPPISRIGKQLTNFLPIKFKKHLWKKKVWEIKSFLSKLIFATKIIKK